MRRMTTVAVLAAATLGLAGCGGDDDGDAADTPSAPTPATSEAAEPSEPAEVVEDDPPAEAAEVGELGSFAVDGTEFAVTSLNRCEPFSGSADDLDLQAIASGSILNLPVNGTELDISVQGSAIEDQFGSISFGNGETPPDFAIAGDRITGSATLEDALGSGSTVEVVFDVQIPDEINEC